MTILSAKDLVKSYGKNNRTRVIDSVNLDVDEGEFIAITGASGSGKSTLLYLLAGLETPDEGAVFFMEQNLASLPDKTLAKLRRTEISFVYQFNNLLNNLSVFDNLVLPGKIDGKIPIEDKKYLDKLIDIAGIRRILNKFPAEISGGEQQRAAIVRALFIRPKVIFLDEPTGSLDSENSLNVMRLLKELNEKFSTAVILVTHSAEVASFAKKIVKIKDGRVLS